MKKSLFATTDSPVSLIMRLILGPTFMAHGAQKAFGWFGGYGFEGTMQYFMNDIGLPWLLSLFVILIELLGGLFILLGFATRVCAFCILALVIGIVSSVHWRFGFFMNWEGTQGGEGIEYFLLVLAITSSLTILGGGKFSVDGWIVKFFTTPRAAPNNGEAVACLP